MINLQKFNRIKVKNEEEFDTVVADLAEQGVTYKGYLPISDEVRADIAKSFRKDFPKYVTLEILNGELVLPLQNHLHGKKEDGMLP